MGLSVGEEIFVDDPVSLSKVDHLTTADICMVELRVLLDGEHTRHRSPRLGQQVDLLFVEALTKIVGELDRVGDDALQRERVGVQ